MTRPTQQERILRALLDNPDGLCNRRPKYEWTPGIDQPAARVFELKQAGHDITSTTCTQVHSENVSAHVMYVMTVPAPLGIPNRIAR